MKKVSAILTAIFVLALLLAACSPSNPLPAAQANPTPTAQSILLKDAMGNEVSLDAAAQHVISLAPSNTEILFALGAGSQMIARDDFSNYPADANSLPTIGGSMGKYNLEEIARLQPDLVLASPLTAPEQVKAIQEVTSNVFVLPNPEKLDGLYENLETVGVLTGRQVEAEKLVADLRARAQAVQDQVSGAADRPKVFYELDATDPSKPWTAGPGTFIDLLITQAGGQNIGASLSGDYAQISQEELIVQNPDLILLGDSTYGGITPEQVAARPGWDTLQAVKNNRVLPFNDDLVSRPGPRMIDGLEALAQAIHPDLFK